LNRKPEKRQAVPSVFGNGKEEQRHVRLPGTRIGRRSLRTSTLSLCGWPASVSGWPPRQTASVTFKIRPDVAGSTLGLGRNREQTASEPGSHLLHTIRHLLRRDYGGIKALAAGFWEGLPAAGENNKPSGPLKSRIFSMPGPDDGRRLCGPSTWPGQPWPPPSTARHGPSASGIISAASVSAPAGAPACHTNGDRPSHRSCRARPQSRD
jgi:hypothetical protein